MARQSVLDYFYENVAHYSDRAAIQYKVGGAYTTVTWRGLGEQVDRLASGLVALGLAPGDRVVIVAHSRLEWILADLAILAAGGVTVPIYPSNLADECQYTCENSGAAMAIVEDQGQAAKLIGGDRRPPGLGHLIQIDGQPAAPTLGHGPGVPVTRWVDLAAHAVDPGALAARRATLRPEGLMSIIYTSGTTGRPKGVMVTHDNMLYEAAAIAEIDIVRATEVQILFLPLAHVFAKMLAIAWLSSHHLLVIAENMQTLRENMGETHPTLLAGVPRVFEKFYAAVVAQATAGGLVSSILFKRALALSAANGEAETKGARLSPLQQVQFAALKRVVFRKVGRKLGAILGGKMRLLVSGGAPLSPKIAWFFRDAGIDLVEGFGLTETSAASCVNRVGHNRIGSVGTPLPGTEVKLAADGELLMRGRGVSPGYWQNDEATRGAFVDGWFATGDIATFDADGSIRIVDRKKDLIVTAGGKNVAPQNIENLIKTGELISQVVVHGDRRNFLSALITLDADALKRYAEAHGLGNGSYAELSQRPEVYAAVQATIDGFNRQLASFETIKKFKVLEHDFTQDTGELTPSLKVKRKVVAQRYARDFDAFYEAPGAHA